ncbi:hypothetical protein D3C87_1682510 [compost metagenome]
MPTTAADVLTDPKYEPAYTTPCGGALFSRMNEVSVCESANNSCAPPVTFCVPEFRVALLQDDER